MKQFLYCALCILVVLTTTDAGATGAFGLLPDRGDAFLSFYLDNDLFAGTDENYTNGARLAWISGSRDPKQFGTVQRALRKLTGDAKSLKLFQRISGFRDLTNIEYNYGTSITQLSSHRKTRMRRHRLRARAPMPAGWDSDFPCMPRTPMHSIPSN